MLIAHGAKVNDRYARGYFPLDAAATGGSAKVVSLLLKNGADPARVAGGVEALLTAANGGAFDVLKAWHERKIFEAVTLPETESRDDGKPPEERKKNRGL